MGARSFIDRLPGKLEYNVMERGATLSVGQRQLISFIRAMVYDPKIIVLDEATSSVDTETEELIQSAIQKMMAGRTSLVIAHRLSTIHKADKIVVLLIIHPFIQLIMMIFHSKFFIYFLSIFIRLIYI